MSQVTSYVWDEENRLVGVVNPDASAESFAYAGDGQRRSKSTLDDLIEYVWDGENVLQEVDGNTNQVKAHYTDYPGYWGGLTSLHTEEGTPASGAQFNAAAFGSAGFNQSSSASASGSFFYLFDLSANTRYLTDEAGEVSDAYVYRAFGELVVDEGDTRNIHGYHGEVGPITDAPDRIKMGVRIYDSETGQWFSIDPIGPDGMDWNLYRFIGNSPGIWVDPYGLQKTTKRCKGICGPNIDSWMTNEITKQLKGIDLFKRVLSKHGWNRRLDATLNPRNWYQSRYAAWALGNQRYKSQNYSQSPDPKRAKAARFGPNRVPLQLFDFNRGYKGRCATGSCGGTVYLCGHCIHTSTLGNIMFGFVGNYAGIDIGSLIGIVNLAKRRVGATIDPYDARAYELGWRLKSSVKFRHSGANHFASRQSLCGTLSVLLKSSGKYREGLRIGSNETMVDFSGCAKCGNAITKEKEHGGSKWPTDIR